MILFKNSYLKLIENRNVKAEKRKSWYGQEISLMKTNFNLESVNTCYLTL